MSILISTIGVWAVALLLLLLAGWGVGRWLTPAALRPYELWLTPLWGYNLLVFVAYYGLQSVLTLRWALIAVLALALLLGAWRLLRPGVAGRFPRAPLGETLAIAALGGVAALLGIVPLLRAGYLLPIGHGWDIEFYLPLALYLGDYTYRTLPGAPPAPLLNVILAEPTAVRAIGFSYLHGMLDQIGGWSPIGTFPLLLALIRALSIAPVYLLLRVGLRAGRVGAAIGALLVAANSLLLWIGFNNFAMHVSSMPLIPLATLLTLLALAPHDPTPESPAIDRRILTPAVLGAIGATTAITLSYHPALLAYGALAGGVGVWALIVNRDRPITIGRGAAIVIGCALLGWLAHWRAPRAFFDVYAARTPSIGGERFARPTELFGVETFHHLALAVDQSSAVSAIGWLALALLAGAIGVALWRGLWRGPTLALLVFVLLYALGLRFVIAFPYGFYKGVSYLSFVPLGVAGVGIGALVRAWASRRIVGWLGAAGTLAIVLGMTAWSDYRLLQTYRAPVLASGEIAALAANLRDVPADGTIELVDHPELRGPPLGLIALGLYNHPWIGRGQTGFAVFNNQQPGTQARYGLMHVGEDPRAWGFAPDGQVMRGGSMALYRAPDDATAFLSGNPAAYARAGGSLQQRLNSLEVQDLTHGDFVTVTPESALRLYAAADRLSWQPIDDGASQPRSLTLDVSSAAPQMLSIDAAGQTLRFDLPRGVSRIATPPLPMPGALDLRSDGPIVVRSAQLWSAQPQTLPVAALDDTMSIATATQAQGATAETQITVTGDSSAVVRIGLELYEINERTPRRYAGGSFAVRANEPATLGLDLQNPAATLNGGPIALTPGEIGNGDFFAALWIYRGNSLIRRVPFVRFERRDGAIVNVEPIDANATFARYNPPQHAADATIGPARIAGWSLSGPAQPGGALTLGLDWRIDAAVDGEPLLVFAQLLSVDDHKAAAWDGAAGGDWWASPAWQPGDEIWQEIPLAIDPATPPGRYRVAVGLYRASSGERLPVSGAGAQGGMIVLDEIEVR